ncbi:unnamed protein product [Rangifer tarandus platyrhynchus]|uniref:Uncharacterized protein n=1 Tax=Rangifer tarandus platyrhynchus TaxID=3082113 RepID=A0AC59YPE5_RANTA
MGLLPARHAHPALWAGGPVWLRPGQCRTGGQLGPLSRELVSGRNRARGPGFQPQSPAWVQARALPGLRDVWTRRVQRPLRSPETGWPRGQGGGVAGGPAGSVWHLGAGSQPPDHQASDQDKALAHQRRRRSPRGGVSQRGFDLLQGATPGRQIKAAARGHAASMQQLVDPESTALHSFHASALGPSGVLSALQDHSSGKCRLPGGLVLNKGPAETLL